jgi:von Willebrand factor type A domain
MIRGHHPVSLPLLTFATLARFATPPLVALLLGGCATELMLTPIKRVQNKPSNVAIYFKLQNASGEPIGGLAAEQFRIYEDGAIVSRYESKQTILNPEVAASHYTLLLVDMSGSVAESGNRESVVEAAGTFADRVEKSQKVAVYAFDGSEELHPIVPFTDSTGSAKAGVQRLGSYKPQDPSTNLNGAVVRGLAELDRALAHSEHPLRFGTLVVFTDGTDRAARVSAEEMRKRVRESTYDVFAIGLGAEIQEAQLRDIGKSGTTMAADKESVVKAFDTIGGRIEGSTKSFYLLSYCSPARAGKHEVRIEAVAKVGDTERTGSLRSDFDATGFAPNCDPNTPPTFDLTKGDALAPPPPPEKRGGEPAIKVQVTAQAPKPAPKSPKEDFAP